jgi:cell division transport system ATP-binding protein
MITAQALSKKFGDFFALKEISLHIEPGEFVFLIGSSGSGKTTLFRLILKEFVQTSGKLIVDNQEIKDIKSQQLPIFRRNIGTIFQDFRLLPERTVFENIALPLLVSGKSIEDTKNAVNTALEMVEIVNKAQLFPAQLSGGEIQRVSIARAIANKPKIILADEPTGNLDPKTAKSIVKLLKDIHTDLKSTILMATHNADIVNQQNLRVIKIKQGVIAKDLPLGNYDDE